VTIKYGVLDGFSQQQTSLARDFLRNRTVWWHWRLPIFHYYSWLVVWNIFYFPYIGNNDPNWLIFFRGVETTNQILSPWYSPLNPSATQLKRKEKTLYKCYHYDPLFLGRSIPMIFHYGLLIWRDREQIHCWILLEYANGIAIYLVYIHICTYIYTQIIYI